MTPEQEARAKQITYRFMQLSDETQIKIVMAVPMTHHREDAKSWVRMIKKGALYVFTISNDACDDPKQIQVSDIEKEVDKEYYKWRDSFMN